MTDRGQTTRRTFLRAAAAAGAATAWAPAFRVGPAAASARGCRTPPAFPPGIELYQQAYENWARETLVDDVWTCTPRTPADVVTLANWAHRHGWRLRAQGSRHGWAPLTISAASDCDERLVLVDTTQHLTAIEVLSTTPGLVRAQAGAMMEALLTELADHGLGLTATPAPGNVSVGGVLAIDAHGTAIPAIGEQRAPGQTYGSLSNRVVTITAVVWSARRRRYVLRTFPRAHPDCAALMTHLGRAFVTEVQLRAGPDVNLRCVSDLTIPVTELFAAPAAAGPATRTFASFVEEAGRAEIIWFAYTDRPWLKTWTVSPTKPAASRAVTAPYNYSFSDSIPVEASNLAAQGLAARPDTAPAFGALTYAGSVAGLRATQTSDIWGRSKDLLLYIRPTTIRATANGYVVLCRRADIQRVVSDFAAFYSERLAAYREAGRYPVTLAVEIRVTGLDDPAHVGVKGARSPTLSALHPRRDHPGWDTGVWLDVLTFAGHPDAQPFFRELEQWIFSHYTGDYATVRPEWSKGWAYSGTAGWADRRMLKTTIPQAYRAGRRSNETWDAAVRTLDALDPHRVFTNRFLDRLLVARARRRR